MILYTLDRMHVPYLDGEEGDDPILLTCMSSPGEAPIHPSHLPHQSQPTLSHSRLRLPKLRPGTAGIIGWRVPGVFTCLPLVPICSLHA